MPFGILFIYLNILTLQTILKKILLTQKSILTANNDKLNRNTSLFNSIGNKIKDTAGSALENFAGLKTVIDGLGIAFETFEAEITARLSILITFAPEILKWIVSLTKGKDAITQAKLSLDTLNKALQSSDYSNAIKQMNELKINVGLAKKGFLDIKEGQQEDDLYKMLKQEFKQIFILCQLA